MDKIVITNTTNGTVSNFRYGSWMNPWWNSTVTLNAQSLFEYQLSVFTATQDSGKFSGDVYVQFQGNYTSDWIKVIQIFCLFEH